ncbi:leucine-rich repeat domain-containing protein [Leptospira noguchii]|uniref:leucine-rich repeat domain-containing protein n=1 Tax=Leptospira noguchii TaxID=28182 RepID=UPI001FB797D8|nr:leucine-rich repeat domain-containing protein [Leptospira noguchii]UOG50799.1 leucine-rich repeat domain-containing protein [Leptospira noguchii]
MKHHFGDFLDRTYGHWTMVPNVERHKYHQDDWSQVRNSVSVATIYGSDLNWKSIGSLPKLEELTLHQPNKEQLDFIPTLWGLKRLRITHARPKTIDFLSRLQNIEELVLEYVSGFESMGPIGKLKNLRALHIENVRRVTNFSGLSLAKELRYLSIYGTLDWKQPIESFDFLFELKKLECFHLAFVRSLAKTPALEALASLKNLKEIFIPDNIFVLLDYALVEVGLPNVKGSTFPPFEKSKSSLDINGEWFNLLGKKAGRIKSTSPKAKEKCEAHLKAYEDAKQNARKLLGKSATK